MFKKGNPNNFSGRLRSGFKYPKRFRALTFSVLSLIILNSILTLSDLPIIQAASELLPTANTWQNYGSLTNTPPGNRWRHVSVWDTADNLMIIHGGFNNGGSSLNDTWKLDPKTGIWTQFSPNGGIPPTRVNGCGVWDTLHNELLVFGGNSYTNPTGTTNVIWSFSPSSNSGNGTWKQFTPADPNNIPPEAQAISCTWDSGANKMLVYSSGDDRVWAFDPGAGTVGSWIELTAPSVNSCATAPGIRLQANVVWNPELGQMLVWGGQQCSGLAYYTDMWSFNPGIYTTDGGIWTLVTTTGSVPPGRDRAAAVWDPTINQMVIFSSDDHLNTLPSYQDLWSFKQTSLNTGAWTDRTTTILGTMPAGRAGHSGVYDSLHNQILYFGGSLGGGANNTSELWGLGPASSSYRLKFTTSPSTPLFNIQAGDKVNGGPLQIQLTDGNGVNITSPMDITVNLSAYPAPATNYGFSTGTGGSFSPTLTVTILSGSSGSSGTFYYSDTRSGYVTITGQTSSVSSTNAVQGGTITPSTASSLEFTTQPTQGIPNFTLNPAPQVLVRDTYNNIVTNATHSVSLSLSGGDPAGVLSPTSTNPVSTINGVASFNNLAITLGSTTPYTLTATLSVNGNNLSRASNAFYVCSATNGLIVNTLADTNPGTTCVVTLRQAITQANTNAGANQPTAQRIVTFVNNLTAAPGDDLPTVHLQIDPLPDLAIGVQVVATCNVDPITARGKPTVAVDGFDLNFAGSGFILNAGGNAALASKNRITGLAIVNFSNYGIDISSMGNIVTCNYIGTVNGTTAKPNLAGGINITGLNNQATLTTDAYNFIGGCTGLDSAKEPADTVSVCNTLTAPSNGNLISGNGMLPTNNIAIGLQATGPGVKNYLGYNYIGYAADGKLFLPNTGSGVVTTVDFRNRIARLVIMRNRIAGS